MCVCVSVGESALDRAHPRFAILPTSTVMFESIVDSQPEGERGRGGKNTVVRIVAPPSTKSSPEPPLRRLSLVVSSGIKSSVLDKMKPAIGPLKDNENVANLLTAVGLAKCEHVCIVSRIETRE